MDHQRSHVHHSLCYDNTWITHDQYMDHPTITRTPFLMRSHVHHSLCNDNTWITHDHQRTRTPFDNYATIIHGSPTITIIRTHHSLCYDNTWITDNTITRTFIRLCDHTYTIHYATIIHGSPTITRTPLPYALCCDNTWITNDHTYTIHSLCYDNTWITHDRTYTIPYATIIHGSPTTTRTPFIMVR